MCTALYYLNHHLAFVHQLNSVWKSGIEKKKNSFLQICHNLIDFDETFDHQSIVIAAVLLNRFFFSKTMRNLSNNFRVFWHVIKIVRQKNCIRNYLLIPMPAPPVSNVTHCVHLFDLLIEIFLLFSSFRSNVFFFRCMDKIYSPPNARSWMNQEFSEWLNRT